MVNKPVRITDARQQTGGVLAILFFFPDCFVKTVLLILNIIANKS